MNNYFIHSVLILGLCLLSFSFKHYEQEDWGFYAHRKINELAVFTLPQAMLHLYKPNLEYIEEHAVDPDKRRYASIFEGIRHYIDLDEWETLPIDTLPTDWYKVLFQYCSIYSLHDGDTLYYRIKRG